MSLQRLEFGKKLSYGEAGESEFERVRIWGKWYANSMNNDNKFNDNDRILKPKA